MHTTAFTDPEAELGVLLLVCHGPHPVQQHGPGGGGDHDGRRVPSAYLPVAGRSVNGDGDLVRHFFVLFSCDLLWNLL